MKKPTAITLSALAVATLFLGCSAPAALTPTPAPPPADTPLRPAELPPPRPVASPATAERIGTWTFSPIRLPQLLATRATGPAGGGFGGGLVDAYSGELVRFHRVTRRWVLGPNLPAPSPFTPSPFSPTPLASAPPPSAP